MALIFPFIKSFSPHSRCLLKNRFPVEPVQHLANNSSFWWFLEIPLSKNPRLKLRFFFTSGHGQKNHPPPPCFFIPHRFSLCPPLFVTQLSYESHVFWILFYSRFHLFCILSSILRNCTIYNTIYTHTRLRLWEFS